MADINTLRQRLTEAETAKHKLLTGSMRERISRGGTDITYTRADIAKLERYIAELQTDIARAMGSAPRRTILNPYF
ncbi:hypothetical protein B0T40_03185 [Chromobacterium haemolyticum]|uniref:gpW family head-tail joining protein n=1 Tax=Chromobacterium haemolyticum TaxID=394935 RepID=UPI0009D92E67|nr:gpW family head-tail joining protein [Chromobacterium haemolyticum]OQS39752.1 hypothetical protein B0T40_03185 [Chromobacterium haemolyticum]